MTPSSRIRVRVSGCNVERGTGSKRERERGRNVGSEKAEVLAIYVAVGPTDNFYQAKMKIGKKTGSIRDVIPLDQVPKSSFNRREPILAEKRCWIVPKCTLDTFHIHRHSSRKSFRLRVNIIR